MLQQNFKECLSFIFISLFPCIRDFSYFCSGEAIDSGRDTSSSAVRIVPTSSASSTMDIFSTALASADINLDSFQYIEDGMGMCLQLITYVITIASLFTLMLLKGSCSFNIQYL